MITKIRRFERFDFDMHAGQRDVVGTNGQRRLMMSKVLVVGVGRIGSAVALGLRSAGVDWITVVDPQQVEVAQLGPCPFASEEDIGKNKVDLIKDRLAPGKNCITALTGRIQDWDIERLVRQANLVICCANDLATRLLVERTCIQRDRTVMQVAAYDSRQAFRGAITLWTAEHSELACYGCLAGVGSKVRHSSRSDALLTTVTNVLGHVAAHEAIGRLVDLPTALGKEANVLLVDINLSKSETMKIKRRRSCEICGNE